MNSQQISTDTAVRSFVDEKIAEGRAKGSWVMSTVLGQVAVRFGYKGVQPARDYIVHDVCEIKECP